MKKKIGLGALTPEQRKEVFAKRRLTMIAKHGGSEESYLLAMRENASKGGNAVTDQTPFRGGGAKYKQSA